MVPDDENDTLVLRAELRAAKARIHALEEVIEALAIWQAETIEEIPFTTVYGNRENVEAYVAKRNYDASFVNRPRWRVAPRNAAARVLVGADNTASQELAVPEVPNRTP